jgi:hypothetical protein
MNICSWKQIVALPFWWHVHHLNNNMHIQHQEYEDNTQCLALLKWQIPITTSSLITYKEKKIKNAKLTIHKGLFPITINCQKNVAFWVSTIDVIMFHPSRVSSTLVCVTKGLCYINGRVFQLIKESFTQGGAF